MPFPIEEKLVIGVASSALFKLDEADEIFRKEGLASYRKYQYEHEKDLLEPGIAFPFIRRFLQLNKLFPEVEPVEVVLLSHNDPDTGMRVFHSIGHYQLDICRAAFTTGNSPFRYIPAYNVALFLSANENDVCEALAKGHPAGMVLDSKLHDDPHDNELRIAFDFDGVLADDSAEAIYKNSGINNFYISETEKAEEPHPPALWRIFSQNWAGSELWKMRNAKKILPTAVSSKLPSLPPAVPPLTEEWQQLCANGI